VSHEPRVSIAVPYFDTPRLIRICLGALRRFTPALARGEAEVIVIDNGSTVGGDHLRGLGWIRLLRRELGPDELTPAGRDGSRSHGLAVNLAWESSAAPFFLAMHSDTIVRAEGWLDLLLRELEARPRAFGVGSGKLEDPSRLAAFLKRAGDRLAALVNPRARARLAAPERPYLRSHCALSRRAPIEAEGLRPFDGVTTCGRGLHERMEDRGHEAIFIPPAVLMRYVVHVNHATTAENPTARNRARTVRAARRRLEAFYRLPWVQALEAYASR
jgi:hypothetical protein